MTHRVACALRPARAWARPGGALPVEAELRGVAGQAVRLRLALLDLDREAGEAVTRRVRLGPSGTAVVRLRPRLPGIARRGYGLRLTVADRDGAVVGMTETAVEALDGWWDAPRHAAIVDFRDARATVADVRALRAWHVTVAQAYDWMWRHYRYLPPGGARSFTDTLGRTVSLDAVREGVRAGHAAGIATLAYGSVYGAEREHVERHPGDRVFDAEGRPLSLGGTFFINDVRPGAAWRRRLLREYAGAIRRIGFDGVHMDTYGPPWTAVAADGSPVDFAAEYPGLIADGARAVATARPAGRSRTRPGARPVPRVLFNCVEGFPLEATASAPTAALYLELWPPDERYVDLVRWIDRARAVADGRAVVIAAYAAAMRDSAAIGTGPARAAAFEATLLATSVIAAAGAVHHTLAAPDRLLVEGYYPAAIALRAGESRELRAAWRFTARYVHLLSDPGATSLALDGLALSDAAGAPVLLASTPVAGSVWARAVRTPRGDRVVGLVDLRDQAGDRWVAPARPSPRRTGWRLAWPGVSAPRFASPWSRHGATTALRARPGAAAPLPPWRRWAIVVDPAGP